MNLNTTDIPVDGQMMRQVISNNFKQIQAEDAIDDAERERMDQNHTGEEQRLDQKYSGITNKLKERCTNLEEGEEKLDSDKASKVMLYKWWKELDDKFSACVDDLDDKKASKKKVRQEIANLQQEFNKNLNDLRQLVQTDHDDLQDKINHLYAGDPETIKKVVVEVLKEGGVLNA